MKCEYCQYHTSDGRCLYYIGCPYEPSQNKPNVYGTKVTWYELEPQKEE